jgi:hypothetical protein
MITATAQRWRNGQESRRPAGEPIQTRLYEVEPIPGDQEAKAFVQKHHYSRSYPAARRRFGLYRQGELQGVAVFSHPMNQRVLALFPGDPKESVELGRFVLLDEVPANGESFFLARCFEFLRAEGFLGIVSFSDPTARLNSQGDTVFRGHIGTIYQATNATYLGRGTPRTLRLLPDGTPLNERSLSKIRSQERGHVYAEEILHHHGAQPKGNMDPKEWLHQELPRITRPLTHPGNHRYAWILPKKARKHLPPSLPYPKIQTPSNS